MIEDLIKITRIVLQGATASNGRTSDQASALDALALRKDDLDILFDELDDILMDVEEFGTPPDEASKQRLARRIFRKLDSICKSAIWFASMARGRHGVREYSSSIMAVQKRSDGDKLVVLAYVENYIGQKIAPKHREFGIGEGFCGKAWGSREICMGRTYDSILGIRLPNKKFVYRSEYDNKRASLLAVPIIGDAGAQNDVIGVFNIDSTRRIYLNTAKNRQRHRDVYLPIADKIGRILVALRRQGLLDIAFEPQSEEASA